MGRWSKNLHYLIGELMAVHCGTTSGKNVLYP